MGISRNARRRQSIPNGISYTSCFRLEPSLFVGCSNCETQSHNSGHTNATCGRASRYSGENHLCRTQRPICDYLRSHAIAGLLKQLPGYFVIPCGWMAKAPYQMDSRITREDQKHSNEANAQTFTQATLLKGQLKRCIVVPPTICSPRLLYRG